MINIFATASDVMDEGFLDLQRPLFCGPSGCMLGKARLHISSYQKAIARRHDATRVGQPKPLILDYPANFCYTHKIC